MKKLLLTASAVYLTCTFSFAYTADTAAGYLGGQGNISGVTKQDNQDGGYTLTATGTNFTSPTTARDEVSFSFTVDCSEIDLDTTTDLCLFYFDGDAADFGVGYDAETDRLTLTWNTNYNFGYMGSALTASSGVQTFTVSFGDAGSRAWNEEGGYWTSHNLRGNIDSAEVSSIVFTSAGAAAIDSLVVWDKAIAYGTDNGVAVAMSAARVAQSIVPEPSAFGLLAGLGALALVTSRRRRK